MPIVALKPRVILRPLRPRAVAKPAGRRPAVVPDARLLALRTACAGRTVWVLASGPSLTAADVARVHACRATRGDRVFVTNTTSRLAPWADVLFAHDAKWVRAHPAEVAAAEGLVVSMATALPPAIASAHGVIKSYKNSGAAAISLALWAGAARVICLGLDCQPDAAGRNHWHGRHPAPLGDAGSLPSWPARFGELAAVAQAQGVPVLNASRATALTCFPRVALEDVAC